MYPHLTGQNPRLTNHPSTYDPSKRHPAFGPSQSMAPIPTHFDPRRPRQPSDNRPFDPSITSPIFYGYAPVQPLPPMGPKL
ncbi:hypothetical protein [Absidia glauca]|uniref:Uncharacterized protein n=1 Tax=Absidia glauca TaxID=4829 RepID=A0A168PDA9_ABSGL|nr:hypothetical protein [Absidia glauca]